MVQTTFPGQQGAADGSVVDGVRWDRHFGAGLRLDDPPDGLVEGDADDEDDGPALEPAEERLDPLEQG
ncbi:MAG: hypothetical protein HYX94_13715 [Chloroflexi bacterium]|nr:hypothetical protein [Chloroflexota bacterium]